MNIAVYCGASKGNNPLFVEAAQLLGQWIADNGHTLVYGGGKAGLMGIIADEVLSRNGNVIGVIPNFLVERELSHPHLTTLHTVNTMSERKNMMIDLANCYIALPGGPGTLEEIAEVISWARLGQHQNPCILFNSGGYYNKLKQFFDQMVDDGFLTEEDHRAILFTDSFQEIDQHIANYKPLAARTYK